MIEICVLSSQSFRKLSLRSAPTLYSKYSGQIDGLGQLALITADGVLQQGVSRPTVDLAAGRVRGALIALAHQIAKPRSYVGFSAFLLMALLKRCRPQFWIGSNLDDIVGVYIPNFAEQCTQPCHVEGVCVALVQNDRHVPT